MTMQEEARRADAGAEPVAAKPTQSPDASARSTSSTLPDDVLSIVPVRNVVLFPGIVMPLSLGRPRSIAAAQEAARSQRPLGVLLQRVAEADDPTPEQLYEVGCLAGILRYVTAPDGNHHIVCQGQQRFRVREFVPGHPFLAARIERIEEPEAVTPEVEGRLYRLKEQALEALQLLPQAPPELINAVQAASTPSQAADLVASFMDLRPEEKQQILEAFDLRARLDKVLELLEHRIEVLKISRDIGQQTRDAVEGRQREYILREQLKAIQKELGETEGTAAEIQELEKAIAEAGMPEEAEQQAKKELKRLERMPEAAAEHSMVRTYLDWLIELPWSKLSEDTIDIAEARRILDEDHYGLPKIKRRILEYLAVRKLNPAGQEPDPVLRRPARRRQDLARPEHRARDRAQVRAHQPRRRPRRGRDPRPPAHLYRRAARQHHPGHPQGGHAQSGVHARRDGQARRRVPRRSVVGAARGARSGAEQHLPRQLPGRAVRPQPGDVHRHRERAGLDPGAAARSHGGDRAAELHRGREGRDREALPGPAPARGERAEAPSRPRSARRRCASWCATTRARRACAISSARSARCCATSPCASPKAARSACASSPRTCTRSSARPSSTTRSRCAPAFRAWRPASPGRRSAATSCSSRRPASPAAAS